MRAPLQAKTGWEWPRKRANENYCSYQFLPDPEKRIRKKQQKKFKKEEKTPLWLMFMPKQDGKGRERE